jgi:hypothetical protein
LKSRIGFFLLLGGMMFFSFAATGSNRDQCLASCRQKCSNSLATCKQNAKSKSALANCQGSYSICSSQCLDKVCPAAPPKK